MQLSSSGCSLSASRLRLRSNMFKAIRRYYWLTQVFIKKHLKVIIRSTTIVLLFLVLLFLFSRYFPTPKDTIKIGRAGRYTESSLPQDIADKIGEGLVKIEDDGTVIPSLASSWEISGDGKIYTFKLDTSKTWHNQDSLTSSDINYSFKDVEIERLDNELKFTLQEPFAPFIHALASPVLKTGLLGTGEYRVVKLKKISGIIQLLVIENDISRLIYKFYPTENSTITAYKLGEVNSLENISTIPAEIEQDSSSQITTPQQDRKIAALFINNQDSILSSKTTRQGLAYAIRDKSNSHHRALSPIAKDSWAYNNLVKDYDFDSSKAATLFSQDVSDPSTIKIELKTMLPYLDVAEKIASDWRLNLGIAVDVKVVSTLASDYQVILADFSPPNDPDQYTLWHSTQPTNFTHYSNLKVDKLLEDGRRTLDQKLRKEIYQDFQRFLLEDSPAIFLFETTNYSISRKSLL